MTLKIYHNPRCSKSRETLGLIKESGLAPEIIEYLKTPPSKSELKKILKALGLKPRDLLRKGEEAYKALKLDDKSRTDEEILDAMIEHPVLIERPIVVSEKGVRIGRPPQSVMDIL